MVPWHRCGEECSARSQYKCGEICVENQHQCHCGDKNITYDDWHLNERLCCVPPDQDCSLEAGDVTCTAGEVIEKYKESCNGNCWDSEFFFGCETTKERCIKYRDLCHGFPLCRDKSDIKFCTASMECQGPQEWDPMTRCGAGKGDNTSIGHGECYYSKNTEDNNGRYDCLDRSDELETDATNSIDYTSLITPAQYWEKNSTSGELLMRLPSIECQENRGNWFWCNNQTEFTCFNVSLRNPVLCQNHTFWENHENVTDCNFYFPDDTVKYAGLRCSGEWHHCYSPVYMRAEFDQADTRSSSG